jgi:hypothetical protein
MQFWGWTGGSHAACCYVGFTPDMELDLAEAYKCLQNFDQETRVVETCVKTEA